MSGGGWLHHLHFLSPTSALRRARGVPGEGHTQPWGGNWDMETQIGEFSECENAKLGTLEFCLFMGHPAQVALNIPAKRHHCVTLMCTQVQALSRALPVSAWGFLLFFAIFFFSLADKVVTAQRLDLISEAFSNLSGSVILLFVFRGYWLFYWEIHK